MNYLACIAINGYGPILRHIRVMVTLLWTVYFFSAGCSGIGRDDGSDDWPRRGRRAASACGQGVRLSRAYVFLADPTFPCIRLSCGSCPCCTNFTCQPPTRLFAGKTVRTLYPFLAVASPRVSTSARRIMRLHVGSSHDETPHGAPLSAPSHHIFALRAFVLFWITRALRGLVTRCWDPFFLRSIVCRCTSRGKRAHDNQPCVVTW